MAVKAKRRMCSKSPQSCEEIRTPNNLEKMKMVRANGVTQEATPQQKIFSVTERRCCMMKPVVPGSQREVHLILFPVTIMVYLDADPISRRSPPQLFKQDATRGDTG